MLFDLDSMFDFNEQAWFSADGRWEFLDFPTSHQEDHKRMTWESLSHISHQ